LASSNLQNKEIPNQFRKKKKKNPTIPSTAKQAETTAYENVQSNPFTKVHGRPTQSNYETLKSEASTLASKVEDIKYSWS
jgi:hypothetical protein